MNLKRKIRIKTKKNTDKKNNNNNNNKNKIQLSNEQENTSDKENIPQNKNDKIYTYNNNNNKNHYLNRRIINKKKVIENEDKQSTDYITHSLSVDNYIELNNKSLMKFQKDLENSQIFDENFIKGIKNVKRKKELLKAIEKYKRYKSLGKLRINNNNFFNNSFSHGFGRKNKDNNNERINTFDKTNYKIIEEENENDSESEITLKNSKINEVNKIKINKNIKNLNDFFNNDKTKDFIKNIRERIKQKNNNTNQNINANTNTITNLKPKEVLVRQILREERYIIDENGKERLLEVNQSFLPKKINIKKLEYMNQLNLRAKSKSIDIDDEIIKKERYRDNNRKILITNKNLAKMKSQNLIHDQNKRSFINMSSYNNNTINGHVISTIKYRERPIILNKYQNKIDKINLIKWNEIKNLRNSFVHRNQEQEKNNNIGHAINNNINNNNHTYHEISSFSGRKQEVNKRPTKKIYNNNSYNINEKRLLNNNSYQQIKYHKSSNFVLNDYRTNRNVSSSDFYNLKFEKNKRIFQNDCNYDTDRHHKNYSIHEIIEIKNKNKQFNTKRRGCFLRPYEECKNSNSNGVYIATSPDYNIKCDTFHSQADSIRSQYNIYKKDKIINRINPIYISNYSVRNSNIRERIKTNIY